MIVEGGTKPPLGDLAHVGVLGMKWGHRKAASGAEIIQARRRIANKQNAIWTANEKAKASTKRGTPGRDAANKKIDTMVNKANKDLLPDRVIASRMTRGEKAISILLAAPTAGLSLAPIVVSSGVSRHLENKLDKSKKK